MPLVLGDALFWNVTVFKNVAAPLAVNAPPVDRALDVVTAPLAPKTPIAKILPVVVELT